MAYLPHCAVIIQGVLGTGILTPSEIWQTGHQISDTNFENLPSQAQVDDICQVWVNAVDDSGMNLSGSVFMTGITVAAIAADGSWRQNTDGSYMKRTSTHTAPGEGFADPGGDYPVSSVASLMTARAGAHGRGRMYWPLPAEPVDASGHCSATACTNRAQVVGTSMSQINSILATGTYQGRCVVASRAGFNTIITGVRVGDVHDTQRRRRNNLAETYQSQIVV